MNANKPVGRVVSLHAGSDGDQVVVQVEAGVMCQRCAAGNGCGAGLLGSAARSKLVSARIDTNLGVSCGDRVGLELRPASVLGAAVLAYGYPLVGAACAALVALVAELGDAGATLLTALGLVVGFFFARAGLRGNRCSRDFTPVVTQILSNTGNGN